MLLWTVYDGELYLENWPLNCEEKKDCEEYQKHFEKTLSWMMIYHDWWIMDAEWQMRNDEWCIEWRMRYPEWSMLTAERWMMYDVWCMM